MKTCSVEGCNEKHHAHGYCSRHYQQFRKHQEIKRTIYDKNDYIFHDDYIEMLVYNKKGEVIKKAIIDIDDYDLVKQYKWGLVSNYIINYMNNIFLHRLVINASDDKYVDHIDGNTMNNRKHNLREVTHQQNNMNKTNKGQGNNKRKGVSYRKDRGKWRAYITVDNKQINLGMYDTEEEAIKVREEAEIKYFGEYRRKEDE